MCGGVSLVLCHFRCYCQGGDLDGSVELWRVLFFLPSVTALTQSPSLSTRKGSLGLEESGW